ncbi:MAG: DUF805 domain-containing protein [Tateyamaria sp.]
MTLIDAIKTCFSKYVIFSGRATRSEFWKFALFILLFSMALVVLNSALFGPTVTEQIQVSVNAQGEQTQSIRRHLSYNGGWFGTVFTLIVALPWLAVTWRRLHDTGRRGLLALLPLVGFALLAAVLLLTGNPVPIDSSALPADAQFPESVNVPSSPAAFIAAWLLTFGSIITVVVWLARPSQPGPNKYGPNPHEVPQ